MLRVCVAGCYGRMGSSIIKMVSNLDDVELVCATASNPSSEDDVNYRIYKIEDLVNEFDVCIDFTLPDSTIKHLEKIKTLNKPVVIGTTGLSEENLAIIKQSAKEIPILLAPNTSLGINILYSAVDLITKKLPNSWQVKIEETHHIHKKDNPSGSAVKLSKVAKNNLGFEPECTGYREGEVIGNHKVTISGKNEELILEHDAKDRALFAEGAILAARWLATKEPGLYEMKDVLGL